MATTSHYRSVYCAVLAAAAMALWPLAAVAQVEAFTNDAWAEYDALSHSIIVHDTKKDIYYRYRLPASKPVTKLEFNKIRTTIALGPGRPVVEISNTRIVVTFGNGSALSIPVTVFTPFTFHGTATSAALPGPNAISVSNDADTFDTTCDGRLMVVVGANSPTPVSLVDVTAGREVATVAYPAKLARSAAIGDDERSVLVVLDNTSNTDASAIRRLTIGPDDTLVDAGEQLFFGTDFVSKVRIAPGSKTGVALVGQFPARLVAFTLPGLMVKGSVTLAQGIGNAIVFSPLGERVYARSGRRAIVPDVIEGFAFDPVAGTIGQAATLTINDVAGFKGVSFNEPMAISADGRLLIAAEEAPAARITGFSAGDGAIVRTSSHPGTVSPRIVGAGRQCAQTTAQAVVEYYHAAFDHYFVTGIDNEITMLDDGTLAGWTRTGQRFIVYPPGAPGSAATCRFFSTAFGLRSSHFYTPVAGECATVKANPDWQFEGEVFNLALPSGDGSCTSSTTPLFRLYNNGQGGAPSHRYTTRTDVRAQMIGLGWTPEGLGDGVVACVPPDQAAAAR